MSIKLVTSVAIIAMSCTALAKLTKDSTEAEFRAVADAVLAEASVGGLSRLSTEQFWISSIYDPLTAFRQEYDAKFEAKFSGTPLEARFPVWVLPKWPKVAAMSVRGNRIEEVSPVILFEARRLNVYCIPKYVATAGDIETAVSMLSEMVAKRDGYFKVHLTDTSINHMASVCKAIQSHAQKQIKKLLRRQGKSFVTKDGVNPVEQYLTRLNAALNAPRFAGLNEWLAEVGVVSRVDLSSLPSAEDVDALKEKILDGDVDMTPETKVLLYICLGVDGYNAFVKEYNGDK